MMNRAIFSGGVHSWVGPRWSSACPFNRDSITRRKDKIVYSGTLGEGYVSLILDVSPRPCVVLYVTIPSSAQGERVVSGVHSTQHPRGRLARQSTLGMGRRHRGRKEGLPLEEGASNEHAPER